MTFVPAIKDNRHLYPIKVKMIKTTKISANDLLWLAGLLEGDGCFHLGLDKRYLNAARPSVSLKMVDEDVVKRVSSLFGVGYFSSKIRPAHHQKTYATIIRDRKATSLMRLIYPFMGIRRQEKINDILSMRPKNEEEIYKYFSCKDEVTVCDGFIHWLSGLLEAEGSFLRPPPSDYNSPAISIQMTDKDIMERVANFFGTACLSYQPKGKTKDGSRNFKLVYISSLRNQKAVKLMSQLKPLMSARRQLQIQRALDAYNPNCAKEASAKRRAISDSMLEEVLERNMAGQSARAIALHYGVDKNVILRALKRFNNF